MATRRKKSFDFQAFQVDEATKKILLVLYKVLAIPSLVAAIFILSDIFFLTPNMDKGIVINKEKLYTEGVSRRVEIRGEKHQYWKEVGKRAYHILEKGDRVILTTSPLFREVKKIRVIKGEKQEAFYPMDIFYMGLFALLCLSTVLPYVVGLRFFSKYFFIPVVASPFLAFASLILLLSLFLRFLKTGT